tara:strand:+ start:1060 stop:1311 length:252 start_codon:yes stop_codon:yes gene_type:complete
MGYYNKKSSWGKNQWIDSYAEDILRESRNWSLLDWVQFRGSYWPTYFEEKDDATRLAMQGKGNMYFRAKKLNKVIDFNLKFKS